MLGLRHWVAKLEGLENQSLWQRPNLFLPSSPRNRITLYSVFDTKNISWCTQPTILSILLLVYIWGDCEISFNSSVSFLYAVNNHNFISQLGEVKIRNIIFYIFFVFFNLYSVLSFSIIPYKNYIFKHRLKKQVLWNLLL